MSAAAEATAAPPRPAAPAPKVAKQTAYFLFSLENREAVREECAAAGLVNPNGAAVAKVLGEKWNGLTAEQKAYYKQKSNRLMAEAVEKERERIAEAGGAEEDPAADGDEDEKDGPEQWDKDATHLPLARVKRLMRNDRDVRLVLQESLQLITKATELFIEHLVECADQQCRAKKRKTIMYADIETTVAQDRRLANVFYEHLWAARPVKATRMGNVGSGGPSPSGEAKPAPTSQMTPKAAGLEMAAPINTEDEASPTVLATTPLDGYGVGGSLVHDNAHTDSDNEFCIA